MSASDECFWSIGLIGSPIRPECDHSAVESGTNCPECGSLVIRSRIERAPAVEAAYWSYLTDPASWSLPAPPARPRDPWQEPDYVPEWAKPKR